jgi:UPF0755 protein
MFLSGLFILFLCLILFRPANPFASSVQKITIPPGASTRFVENILVKKNILPRFSIFRPLLRLCGLQGKIKAGDYSFSPADPLPVVVTKLLSGQTIPLKEIQVTFPEGTSIYKMGLILKGREINSWQEFQKLSGEGISPSLRERHRSIFRYVPSESLEGYLFPDTYQFFKDASAEVMAEEMVRRFEELVLPFWEQGQKDSKMNLHEILTLASIIEKEAKIHSEREVISSVYHNRLRLGMPLAADPTIKYALERPTKIVYFDQLSIKSPYNTYKRKGLPPGPICNPGLESIKAAAYPAKTDYYFFVAKKDGSHIFSRTWQEHQRGRIKN